VKTRNPAGTRAAVTFTTVGCRQVAVADVLFRLVDPLSISLSYVPPVRSSASWPSLSRP